MKTCVGITLYNPEIDRFQVIDKYSKHYDIVYVYDNSENNQKYSDYINKLNSNIDYYFNGSNDGLSVAYNYFLKKALENNYDMLTIFDQDSEIDDKNIDSLLKRCDELFNQNNDIVIVGPQVDYGNKDIKDIDLEVEYIISSGTCINLKYVKDNEFYFDENYFIDNVDVDYCKMVRLKNYKIVQVKDSIMNQSLGVGKFKHNGHSVMRHYYMFRNDIYYYNKYFSGFKKSLKLFIISLRHKIHIILYEDKKCKKLKCYRLAKKDYKKGHLGKNEGI